MLITRPVVLLLVIAWSSPAFAADTFAADTFAADNSPVLVKDIAVTPRANLTADDGTLTVHPKAALGVGYNSNIFAEAVAENGDIYVRYLAGIQADWRLTPHHSVALNGELEGLNYSKSGSDNANLVGGLLGGDYRWHEANNEVRIHGGYARFNDPLIESGEQILRQNIDGAAQVTWQGSEVRTVIDLGITALDYLEDGSGFTADSRDHTISRLTGRMGFTTARQTFYYLMLSGDMMDYHENLQFNDSTGITAGLGAQVRLGERSTLTAEGGVVYRTYDDNFGGLNANDDKNVYAPYVSIAARWPWESGSHVGLNIFSRIDESITANAAWVYGAQLDGRYRLLVRSGLFGSVGGYHSVDSGQGVGITEERDTVEIAAGIDHEITNGLVGRIKATYTDSTAKISNEFSRYIVAFDLAVAF